jgi:ribosomal protein L11 methyltransferase
MREVIVEVSREAVEDVLDELLPILPNGLREVERGEIVELRMRGPQLPATDELARTVRRWTDSVEERTVPDDWRERRLGDHEPDVIGARLVVRPEWAPPVGDPDLLEIILGEGAAFGAGTHPTTRTCLELLLDLEPRGSFADLGCGTGLLAIAAARLGWEPVVAVDVDPGSVDATRANAAANEVAVAAGLLDLSSDPPPPADGIAANVPAWLHERLAESLPEPLPGIALVSGLVTAEADGVLAAYARRGLVASRRVEAGGWTVAILERDLRAPVR